MQVNIIMYTPDFSLPVVETQQEFMTGRSTSKLDMLGMY